MIELKVLKTGLKINLSPHQISFHVKHAAQGLPTFVLVEWYPSASSNKKPALLLYHNGQVMDLVEQGVRLEPVAQYPLQSVDWSDLAEQLLIKRPLTAFKH
jgi:hypothetical protein